MNAEKLNSWLSVVANIGVLIGIIFLAFEVRQTKDAVMGATYLTRANAQEEWLMYIADSDHLAPVIQRYSEADYSTLSVDDRTRLRTAVEAPLHRLDGIYYQYQLGLVTEEYYSSTFSQMMSIWVPRWKDTGILDSGWVTLRPSFRKEVEKYLDDELLK